MFSFGKHRSLLFYCSGVYSQARLKREYNRLCCALHPTSVAPVRRVRNSPKQLSEKARPSRQSMRYEMKIKLMHIIKRSLLLLALAVFVAPLGIYRQSAAQAEAGDASGEAAQYPMDW